MAVDAFGGLQCDSGFVPPPTTNNRMEMNSIVHALVGLHERCGASDIEVVSDSAYVVLGCQDITRKRNVNLDLWSSLELAMDLHTHVQLRHVPGHKGVKYNELADELAVQAKKAAVW